MNQRTVNPIKEINTAAAGPSIKGWSFKNCISKSCEKNLV